MVRAGVIESAEESTMRDDYLFRVSLKALIQNEEGEVMVVKESGRDWWDLPGGGMEHDDTYATALQRELQEEVGFDGELTIERIITADNPLPVDRINALQVRLIFHVTATGGTFGVGEDADEVAWMDPQELASSEREVERRIAQYHDVLCKR